MTAPSIVFVGESPPAGAPDNFTPFDCASGSRLASILGLLDKSTLLAHVSRDNIFPRPCGVEGAPNWSEIAATVGAENVIGRAVHGTTFVLLGRRVADAFLVRHPIKGMAPGIGRTWIAERENYMLGGEREPCSPPTRCIYVPHPSGRSSVYASGETRREVRQMLLPELILGVPSLRPWHFRLDDPAVLHDLAGAASPLCPGLGAAALLWVAGQHKARQVRMSTPLLARVSAAVDANDVSPRATATRHFESTRDPVMSGDGRYLLSTEKPPWDAPLSDIARACVKHDGARILGAAWDSARVARKAGHAGWLALMAKEHSDLNNYPRHLARATMARYAEAGIT